MTALLGSHNAALTPDADETSQRQQAKFPVTDVFKYIEVAEGRISVGPEGVACFAGASRSKSKRSSGPPCAHRLLPVQPDRS
jgi:hypothetical protein